MNTAMVVNDAFARSFAAYPDAGAAPPNALPVEMIEAQDVTNAVVWLCSDQARYVTGLTLPVDAGLMVR